jgi:ribose 5-phosphate isomerase B
LACDHAGFELKQKVVSYLQDQGFEITDFGSYNTQPVDYPDYAHPMAESIENGDNNYGISLCGSGNGINMVMNKHWGIRSALCWNEEIAKLARSHNNANVCAIPARFIDVDMGLAIVKMFIETDFEGGRHQRRIDKIPIK